MEADPQAQAQAAPGPEHVVFPVMHGILGCWCTACAPWQLLVVKHRCTIPRCTPPNQPIKPRKSSVAAPRPCPRGLSLRLPMGPQIDIPKVCPARAPHGHCGKSALFVAFSVTSMTARTTIGGLMMTTAAQTAAASATGCLRATSRVAAEPGASGRPSECHIMAANAVRVRRPTTYPPPHSAQATRQEGVGIPNGCGAPFYCRKDEVRLF